ncbi:hypothetical protein SAMN03159463_04157 [Mesorhizobium sp. NFR06]|nr:hypothetical protein SAMN03159463_04157 [Mesorhizobium sp. NFR06]
MHQQPPQTPLCRSTSTAKAGQVGMSRGFTLKLIGTSCGGKISRYERILEGARGLGVEPACEPSIFPL